MCEIAIVPNGDTSDITAAAVKMYSRNNDGIGVVAVYREPDVDRFDYEYYKSEEANWKHFQTFVDEHNPWRFIIHARLATRGGTGWEETHPIRVTDDGVDINFVVHNGHVQDKHLRSKLERAGHEYNTAVDSETLAHVHNSLPDSIDDFVEPSINGTLNYILLGDSRILIRNGGKYYLGADMKMSCRSKWYDEGSSDSEYVLFHPDGTTESTETQVSGYRRSSWSRGGKWSKYKKSSSGDSTSSGNSNSSSKISSEDSSSGDSTTKKPVAVSEDEEEVTENPDEYWSKQTTRGWLRQNPPSYWTHVENGIFCSLHRETFSDLCEECVENIHPERMPGKRHGQADYKMTRSARY